MDPTCGSKFCVLAVVEWVHAVYSEGKRGRSVTALRKTCSQPHVVRGMLKEVGIRLSKTATDQYIKYFVQTIITLYKKLLRRGRKNKDNLAFNARLEERKLIGAAGVKQKSGVGHIFGAQLRCVSCPRGILEPKQASAVEAVSQKHVDVVKRRALRMLKTMSAANMDASQKAKAVKARHCPYYRLSSWS